MTTNTAPHINQLRQHLLDTLADLRRPVDPMEPARARAIAEVAGVLVDSAREEVNYLRVTGQDRAAFLDQPPGLVDDSGTPTAHNPFPVSRRHTLEG